MSVKLSPFGPKPAFWDSSGNPLSGGKLYFYVAGSTTAQNTYTDSTGGSANANPVVLNSRGEPSNEIWFTTGLTYKAVLKTSADVTIWSVDNITAINDVTAATADEWLASGLTPTFISTTSFSIAGDQTTEFHIGRRLKTTNSGGTRYSTVSASVFGALTTVTVVNDSGVLDSGLSAVAYGIVRATNPSIARLNGALTLTGALAVGGNATVTGTLGVTGAATVSGALDLSGASAGQIAFPATQNASAGANTLDDYEEGTWTPTPGGTATLSGGNGGKYTKIGRAVHITGLLAVNVLGSGSAGRITGLPFSPPSNPDAAVYVGQSAALATAVVSVSGIFTSAPDLAFVGRTVASVADGTSVIIGNSTTITFAGTFFV